MRACCAAHSELCVLYLQGLVKSELLNAVKEEQLRSVARKVQVADAAVPIAKPEALLRTLNGRFVPVLRQNSACAPDADR